MRGICMCRTLCPGRTRKMHRNAAGIVYASRSKTNPGAEGGTGTQLLPHRVRAVTVRRTVNSLRAAGKLTGSESYAAVA